MAYYQKSPKEVDELRELIRSEVEQTVLNVLGDPDEGLELHEKSKVGWSVH